MLWKEGHRGPGVAASHLGELDWEDEEVVAENRVLSLAGPWHIPYEPPEVREAMNCKCGGQQKKRILGHRVRPGPTLPFCFSLRAWPFPHLSPLTCKMWPMAPHLRGARGQQRPPSLPPGVYLSPANVGHLLFVGLSPATGVERDGPFSAVPGGSTHFTHDCVMTRVLTWLGD